MKPTKKKQLLSQLNLFDLIKKSLFLGFIFSLSFSSISFADSQKEIQQNSKSSNQSKSVNSSTNSAYSAESFENFPISGTDPLFENLLIEFSKYSNQYETVFEWFYQMADEQKSIDYAMIAFRQASLTQNQQALDKAGDLWLRLIESEDDKIKYFYISIIVSMNQGDIESAKENLSEIMQTSDNKKQVLKELIYGFNRIFEQNQNLEYLDLIDYGIDFLDEKDRSEIYFESTKVAFGWGNIEYAIDFSNRALNLEPNNVEFKIQRLGLLASTEKYNQLVLFFDQFFQPQDYDSVNTQIINIYLITSLNQKNYANHFKPLLEYLIANDKDTPIDRYMLGLYSIESNHPIKAKGLLESVVNQNTRVEQSALFNLASVYALLGDFQNSVDYYRKVKAAEHYDSAQFFANLIAATHLNEKNALDNLKAYQKKSPSLFIDSLRKLAQAYQSHQQIYLVRDYLDFVLENFKDSQLQAEIGLTQSTILYLMEDFIGFENLVFDLVKRYPNDANLLNTIGYYFLDHKKDTQKAEGYIVKAYQLNPVSSAVIDSVGWLHFKKQDYKTALSYISKAYSINPNPEILAHLIEVLFYMNQEDQAENLLTQALTRIPQDNYLIAVRDRLFPELKTSPSKN